MARSVSHREQGRSEILADGIVHGLALAAAIAGGSFVLAQAFIGHQGQVQVFCVYFASLLAMLGFSAAYNLLPSTSLQWLLRRCDHSAIYVLIAGTYTPLVVHLRESWMALGIAAVVWLGAAVGVVVKLSGKGGHGVGSVATYLVLGWVGVLAARGFWQALPGTTLDLIVVGGLLYCAGVPFYLWERLQYQRAIWHGFVVAAAACHFVAIALLYV